MNLPERVNSCKCFAEGRCANQRLMERAYLIPQLIDPMELAACEEFCTHVCNSASEVTIGSASRMTSTSQPLHAAQQRVMGRRKH
jgi:hypothetical protein